MRVFASEFLTSGGWTEPNPPASLMREGRAMITAVLADLSRIAGVQPVTLWDAALDLPDINGVEFVVVTTRQEGLRRFNELAAAADATVVIAPEFDQILLSHLDEVRNAGGHNLGCTSAAVRLTADKRSLAEFFEQRNLPTIPTATIEFDAAFPFPVVLKPRFGAGSQDVRFVDDNRDLDAFKSNASRLGDWIVQPFVPGRAISAAAIVRANSADVDVLPICEQRLSDNGTFQYLGGILDPSVVHDDLQAAVDRIVRRACSTIEGLRGYVGFDLIVPPDRPFEPIIVEINPRLTTSYLGYRELTPDNLAERFLFPDRQYPPIRWERKRVRFEPDGNVAVESSVQSD